MATTMATAMATTAMTGSAASAATTAAAMATATLGSRLEESWGPHRVPLCRLGPRWEGPMASSDHIVPTVPTSDHVVPSSIE